MCRRLALIALGSTFLALAVAIPARAADDILKLVPDGALGLVAVRCPADADAKLQELGRRMQLPIPSLLAKFKEEAGIREGLDEKGTAAVIVLPPAGGDLLPTPILLVSVTDYRKFLAQFNSDETAAGLTKIDVKNVSMWVRDIGGYAALTDVTHKEALAELKLSKEVPEALTPWGATLAEKDVAVIILQPGIKLLSARVQTGIQMIKAMTAQAGEQGKQAAAMFDIYVKIFQAAEKQLSAVGFGTRLDREGVLHVTKRARFVAGGSWARLAAQIQPAKENLLAGLPAAPFVVAGGATIPEGVWEPLMAWSLGMMKDMHNFYGLTEEQINEFPKSSLAAMKRIHSLSMVLGVGPSGAPLYSKLVAVMRVDHSDAFMADEEKLMKEYGQFIKNAHSPILQPIEVEKCEIDGAAGLQFTQKVPQMPTAQQTAQVSKMMEVFFGPGGKITGWVVPADEHTVVAGYVNKDFVRSTLQAIKQGSPGLGGDVDVSKTAALLPADAPCIGFWSPQGTVDFVKQIVPTFLPGGNAQFQIPEFDKTPPIGFAVTSAPNEMEGQMVVPAEVFKAIGQYVGKVKGER